MSETDEFSTGLIDLMTQAGLDGEIAEDIRYNACDSGVTSPHKIALGASLAVAAQAGAVAALWREKTGRRQAVTIDAKQAVCGLDAVFFVRQGGYPVANMARNDPAVDMYQAGDDRWIFIVAGFMHHRSAMLQLLDCPNSREAIGAAIRRHAALDLEDRIAELRLPGAAVRTRDEWAQHPQGALLAQRPLIDIRKTGEAAPVPLPASDRPLGGVKVLDLTHVIAGPIVARTMAEHGADVLAIRPPNDPDPNIVTLDVNPGKRCTFLDLRDPAARERLGALVADADVLVDSWRPGSLARLGVDEAFLRRHNPALITAQLSCYGDEGPWGGRAGFDQLGQCASGVAHTEGCGGAPKLVPTYLFNDYSAGFLAAAGVMSALLRRSREGGGYHIHVSLTRTSMWLQQLGLTGEAPKLSPSRQPRIFRSEGAFGTVEQLAPIAQFAETPGFWVTQAVPLGASAPAW